MVACSTGGIVVSLPNLGNHLREAIQLPDLGLCRRQPLASVQDGGRWVRQQRCTAQFHFVQQRVKTIAQGGGMSPDFSDLVEPEDVLQDSRAVRFPCLEQFLEPVGFQNVAHARDQR